MKASGLGEQALIAIIDHTEWSLGNRQSCDGLQVTPWFKGVLADAWQIPKIRPQIRSICADLKIKMEG